MCAPALRRRIAPALRRLAAPVSAVSAVPALAMVLAMGLAMPEPAHSQSAAAGAPGSPPVGFKAEFLGQLGAASQKLMSLAEAMPPASYAWRPSDGVASVAEAYMHIARYNYYYPANSLDAPAPSDVDYEQLEGVVNAKAEVVPALRRSLEHVRQVVERMTDEDLAAMTRLYGREVPRWSVLLQLITHMNQHLGQEIAYARMNGVVPPWSG